MIGDVFFIDTQRVASSDYILYSAKSAAKAAINKHLQSVTRGDFATKKWTHVAMAYGIYSAMHANISPSHVELITINELIHPDCEFRVFRNLLLHNELPKNKTMKLKVFNVLNTHIGKAFNIFKAWDKKSNKDSKELYSNNYMICSTLVAKAICESQIDPSFESPFITYPHDLYRHIYCSAEWIDITEEYIEGFSHSDSYSLLHKTPSLLCNHQKELYRIARNNLNESLRVIDAGVEGKETPLGGLTHSVKHSSSNVFVASYSPKEKFNKDEDNLIKLEPAKYAMIISMLEYDRYLGDVPREDLETIYLDMFNESSIFHHEKNNKDLKRALSIPQKIGNKCFILDRGSFNQEDAEEIFLSHPEISTDSIIQEGGCIYKPLPDGTWRVQIKTKNYDDLYPIWILT